MPLHAHVVSRRLIAVLILFFSSPCGTMHAQAQEWKRYSDSALTLVGVGLCEEALQCLDIAESRAAGFVDDTLRATLLYARGQSEMCRKAWSRADSFFRLAQGEYARVLGGGHESTLRVAVGRCATLLWTGQFLRTIQYIDSIHAVHGDDQRTRSHTVIRYRLGEALFQLGRWRRSEQVLRRVLPELSGSMNPGTGSYANAAYLLANIYFEQGRYHSARELLEPAIAKAKLQGTYIISLMTQLGEVAQALGQREEAEHLFREVLDTLRKNGQERGDAAITPLRDLAVLMMQMGRLREAEKFMDDASAAFASIGRDDPTESARSLRILSSIRQKQGRLDEADSLCVVALARMRILYADHHYLSVRTSARIGLFRHLRGRSAEALPYLEQAVAYARRPDFPDVLSRPLYLFYLGDVYRALGRTDDAARVLLEALQLRMNIIRMTFPSLNEQQKQQFYSTLQSTFDYWNAFVCEVDGSRPELTGAMYDNVLATKSVVFKHSENLTEQIHRSGDTSLTALYERWTGMKGRVARLYTLAATPDERHEADSLAKSAARMEARLVESSSAFATAYAQREFSWRDVRARLGKDEAAIEIVRYRDSRPARKDSVRYAALIITKEAGHPALVVLPDGNGLETRAYDEYRLAVLPPGEGTGAGVNGQRRATLLHDLYRVYWEPIQHRLAGKRRVYLSSDGVYHKLSVNPLLDEDGRAVFEKIEICPMVSTRDIPSAEEKRTRTSLPAGALLLGAPRVTATPAGNGDGQGTDRRRSAAMSHVELRAAREELSAIGAMMHGRRMSIRVLAGDSARETAITSLRAGPDIVHIVSHGWFDSDTNARVDLFGIGPAAEPLPAHPYLHSGLVLAAPQASTAGEGTDEDGLLTAYEVLNSSLRGTQLVVLSACGTGKGIVQNGEGVFGLQRAFILAGARRVVMSLWDVDDRITSEFMEMFYTSALRDGDYRAAFRAAIVALRKARPYLLPCDWAGFVMIE